MIAAAHGHPCISDFVVPLEVDLTLKHSLSHLAPDYIVPNLATHIFLKATHEKYGTSEANKITSLTRGTYSGLIRSARYLWPCETPSSKVVSHISKTTHEKYGILEIKKIMILKFYPRYVQVRSNRIKVFYVRMKHFGRFSRSHKIGYETWILNQIPSPRICNINVPHGITTGQIERCRRIFKFLGVGCG